MNALYQIRSNGSRLARWEIDEECIVVGRSELANIQIADQSLSRRHFAIVREGESCLVEDLHSRNGTWVDGKRVLAVKLRHNDRIHAGQTWFLFVNPAAEANRRRSSGPHGTWVLEATPHPAPPYSRAL